MDSDRHQRKFESVYSKTIRAGKRRTYFFDVRKTKGSDYYLTITESKKRFDSDGYERHKIFLYKEDFNRFLEGLNDTVDHVKVDLMPDYDYDEYTRRHLEYEERKANGEFDTTTSNTTKATEEAKEATKDSYQEVDIDKDLSW